MILKSITPQHFGPFAAETTLHLDPEVTSSLVQMMLGRALR